MAGDGEGVGESLLSPASYTEPVPPRPQSAEYFDGWYADRVATPTVDEIMNRHTGFPPGTRAGGPPGAILRSATLNTKMSLFAESL